MKKVTALFLVALALSGCASVSSNPVAVPAGRTLVLVDGFVIEARNHEPITFRPKTALVSTAPVDRAAIEAGLAEINEATRGLVLNSAR